MTPLVGVGDPTAYQYQCAALAEGGAPLYIERLYV